MHKLCRYVRFSINPFLPADEPGFNSFASKPAGEGLAVFFELGVELAGTADPATGLIVNVSDIDKTVRDCAVPVFAESIRAGYQAARHIGYYELAGLLKSTWEKLADKFGSARLSKLSLKLNPFRMLAVDEPNCAMVYFSEKFEFAASHKLWNERFSEQQNIDIFGKCANPAGHGHNYIVEVTVKWPAGQTLRSSDFERVVHQELIMAVDHKNLNEDVPEFRQTNPTVENIAIVAWNKLVGKFGPSTSLGTGKAALHCVTVWETDKTYSCYYG
ncbi:MAG: 6-carboxytetrahydropterin synthase [Sedimentisphaerales bacterium]|jgi:6-pyruvoyltetrahydropterin/6-carboxytetrahydropterin synthase